MQPFHEFVLVIKMSIMDFLSLLNANGATWRASRVSMKIRKWFRLQNLDKNTDNIVLATNTINLYDVD
jgi:hypothetical protein